MADKVKTIPKGYRTVNAYLIIKGVPEALEFYKKAFNAKEILRMPGPDGKIRHAEVKIGNTIVMMGEETQEMGALSPNSIGGSATYLYLYVRNCDRVFKRAVKAGATVLKEPADQYYGDRSGAVKDPFGHLWGIATHKEDLTPEQLAQRAQAFYASVDPGKQ